MNDYAGIEQKIDEAIQAGLAEGFKLGPFYLRRNVGDDKFCCAVGMVSRDIEYPSLATNRMMVAAERLGIPIADAARIGSGFDSGLNPLDDEFMAIGARLAKKYGQTPAK